MRNDARTIILADREIHQISIMNNGIIRNSNIEISASLLPETNSANKYELKINQTNQGIYLLRQNREIAQALAYTNVWGQKHNSKNRVRIELSVKPELDMEFRIDFNKGKGNPTTELKDQLSNILKPILERYNPYLKPTKGGTTPPTIEPPKPKPPTDIPPLQIEKPLPSDENGGQDPKAVVQIPPVIVSPPEIEEVLVEIPTGSIDTEGSKYKILENIAVFDEKDGYTLELNVISWHGKPAEFDLRYWNHTAGISREGISLSLSEIKNLKTVFKHIKFE
jgi:hypothetical protein